MPKQEVKVLISAEDRASKAFKKVNGSINGAIKSLEKLALGGAAALAGIGVVSVKMAAQFESSMTDIGTLLDGNREKIDELSEGTKKLLKTIPKSADDLGASLYAIVSAGVSDTSEALGVLESAGKLAVAGLGETAEATDILTSAINAFGIETKESDKIADTFFKAVKFGKTTVAELSHGFGQVAPLAKEVGGGFEELLATTSAMTTSGLKASVAYTQIRATLSNMLKPTKDMKFILERLGIENIKADIATDGLAATIERLTEEANATKTPLAKMFGSVEALNAVMMLNGETGKESLKIMEDMKNGSDALTNAFELQKTTFDSQFKLMKNKLSVVMIDIGNRIIPHLISMVEKLSGWMEHNKEKIDNVINSFIRFGIKAGEVVASTMRALGRLTGWIKENEFVFYLIEGALISLAATLVIFKTVAVMQTAAAALTTLSALFTGTTATVGLLGAAISFLPLAITISVALVGFALVMGQIKALKQEIGEAEESQKNLAEQQMRMLDHIKELESGGQTQRASQLKRMLIDSMQFPEFAKGGIVTQPTLAMVGEAGPEAIVPLNKMAGVGGITVNVTGNYIDSDYSAERIGDKIIQKLKKNLRI